MSLLSYYLVLALSYLVLLSSSSILCMENILTGTTSVSLHSYVYSHNLVLLTCVLLLGTILSVWTPTLGDSYTWLLSLFLITLLSLFSVLLRSRSFLYCLCTLTCTMFTILSYSCALSRPGGHSLSPGLSSLVLLVWILINIYDFWALVNIILEVLSQ